MFLPAISYAVPDDGEVLIISSPIVVFTALLKANAFTGHSPWSSARDWCRQVVFL